MPLELESEDEEETKAKEDENGQSKEGKPIFDKIVGKLLEYNEKIN